MDQKYSIEQTIIEESQIKDSHNKSSEEYLEEIV